MARQHVAFWWLLLLLLHAATAAFFCASALFYYWIQGKTLSYEFTAYKIGIESKWYSVIALTHAVVALPHVAMIAKMLGASLTSRSFAFTFAPRKTGGKPTTPKLSSLWLHRLPSLLRCSPAASARMTRWHRSLFDRDGLFGVDSQHFYLILFLRELLELVLQTAQAYRMSFYLPQMLPNRLYVSLLVLNCWATPLIYVLVKKNESKKRMLSLACDCALDFAASVVIPCVVLAGYTSQYDPASQGFSLNLWFDKAWFANAEHEFQILLVASWQDMGMRLVFSAGMLIAMNDIKDLLTAPVAGNQVSPVETMIGPTASGVMGVNSTTSPAKQRTSSRTCTALSRRISSLHMQLRSASATFLASKYAQYAAKAVHGLLFLWGMVVLGFHISVEMRPGLSQCLFLVRPWGKMTVICTLIDLDCHALNIAGSRSQMDAVWGNIEPGMVTDVLVRHCGALEMPTVLQKFSALTTIKLYNTTVVAWDDSAALTNASHPLLKTLFFVRVNMPNSELPPGLHSPDFPQNITRICFCVTNLRSLPDDLDTKWPSLTELYLELGEFVDVPISVTRMKAITLSLFGNPIRELPGELFGIEPTETLHIGSTRISALPANVPAVSSSIALLNMADTQVSFFPEWFDGFVSRWHETCLPMPVNVGLSPYCDQLNGIMNGSRVEFTAVEDNNAVERPPPLSVLMNTSAESLKMLATMVNCGVENFPMYLLVMDDENYAALA